MQKINISPEIRALIFDCDGTLADTMALHWEAWHTTLATHDKKLDQEYLDTMRGVPTKLMVEKINRDHGWQLDPEEFSVEKENRLITILDRTKPIEPVVEVALRNKNKLPMAVASGGERETVLATLESIELGDFFDTVLTAADDVAPKPSPDIFLEAARRMNIEPQYCLVLEDGDAGVQAAKDAGMHILDVRPIIAD